MREDDIAKLLRELRETPVPAASLVRVRSGFDRRLRRRAHWKMAAWTLAVAAALLAAVLFRVPPAPLVSEPAPRQMIVAHRMEAAPAPVNHVPALTVHHAVHRIRRTPRTLRPEPPLIIQIETPDPDVVIRLIGE